MKLDELERTNGGKGTPPEPAKCDRRLPTHYQKASSPDGHLGGVGGERKPTSESRWKDISRSLYDPFDASAQFGAFGGFYIPHRTMNESFRDM